MNYRLNYILFALGLQLLIACTPDEYSFIENAALSADSVKSMKLQANHYMLLADGRAQIEFHPVLQMKNGFEASGNRVDSDLLEYYTTAGVKIPAEYSTTETQMAGQTMQVYARLKGSELLSDTISFLIETPPPAWREVTIPVIFHLMQTKAEVGSYGGEIPAGKIALILEKMNNTFSAFSSKNPVGIDTKIRFLPAVFDQYGRKLQEPGIDRIVLESISDAAKDQYNTFIVNQKAIWPYNKYMNIWLISDSKNEYSDFCNKVSAKCIPYYFHQETDLPTIPKGLTLKIASDTWTPKATEIGVIYKLQTLNKMNRTFSLTSETELTYCIGAYLGLLPTWGKSKTAIRLDYCPDTHEYYGADASGYKNNETFYKSLGKYFFLAENIMDDPTGVHRSVSKNQGERIHWVLENCPERSAWKSDFAFTGN